MSLKKDSIKDVSKKKKHWHATHFKQDTTTYVFLITLLLLKDSKCPKKGQYRTSGLLIAVFHSFLPKCTCYHKRDSFYFKNCEKTGYNNFYILFLCHYSDIEKKVDRLWHCSTSWKYCFTY